MFTHNVITAGLWLLVAVSSGTVGLLYGRLRPSRQLLDEEYDRGHDDGRDVGYQDGRLDAFDETAERERLHWQSQRRTVLLEPGRTTYPELEALAEPALDGLVRHAEPSTSTWVRTILLDWENRYPIPLDSPRGRMAEAI